MKVKFMSVRDGNLRPDHAREEHHFPADRRQKIVSFRVSTDEYDRYLLAAGKAEISGVSELIRVALESFIAGDGPAGLEKTLKNITERLDALETKMARPDRRSA